ncbi:hypothetical protein BVRB_027010, partial [Beta vulgaris subsp. vulgaris]
YFIEDCDDSTLSIGVKVFDNFLGEWVYPTVLGTKLACLDRRKMKRRLFWLVDCHFDCRPPLMHRLEQILKM